jgi:probable phosphoglycerate mutase
MKHQGGGFGRPHNFINDPPRVFFHAQACYTLAMTTFYICRHGQTENNKAGKLMGWIDTPLTDEGVQNAASSAAKLQGIKFDKIIASDLGRAFTTAYLISRRIGFTDEIERSRELREANYGDLANMPYSAYPKLTPAENTVYVHKNGESLAQMQQRVITYVQKVAADNPDKTILLVAHHGTITALRASFTGVDMGTADAEEKAHDFAAKFTVSDAKITSFVEI